MNRRILIVEDDRSFGAMLHKWFERNGFGVTLATGMEAAQEVLSRQTFQVVLSDLRLPDGDGIMLLSWLNEKGRREPVIIMTSYGDVQTAVSAIKMGAFDYLEKPVNPSILSQKIDSACNTSREEVVSEKMHRSQKQVSPAELEAIVIGQSAPVVEMYEHVALVAPTQMAVMITGESGTGKEHVARLIHQRSNRSEGPFVAVDCGGLSAELAPSELFGHKKGSFTTALENKSGFFAAADGGTLFLDEVGNLPYGVQMQLLRTLQEKKIRPVGSAADLDVDVRIVTATNEDLLKAITEGRFREDLYHRINEFTITVPPLRERKEDIALYAIHFMKEANRELEKNAEHITPEALSQLTHYGWPGNLRELRNVMRRAVLFCRDREITPATLPYLSETGQIASDESTGPQQREISLARDPGNEKDKILRALELSGGNKTKAANLLKVDRKTLYNKMHQYGIDL
ncbi:MAG: sigma-54-dependent Fis family transcriptional regulator [Bacteroidales bacterium]|nr:sigma-54-dependent Fis family transcriptional regulator [Bacteroidales bacterium]